MTVAQLIEELLQYPPDKNVCINRRTFWSDETGWSDDDCEVEVVDLDTRLMLEPK